MPITDALGAARNVDFAPTLGIEYFGDALGLVGATVSMEVRLYEGASDPVLAEDSDVAVVSDELLGTATNPESGEVEPLRRLTIEPFIAKADLAELPGQNQPEAGDAQTFWQEIKVTYADDAADSLWIGEFIVRAGVNTQ